MAFVMTLFNCSDDPRTLNKTLEGRISVNNVRPTGIVDLMSPTFELDYDSRYTTKNYCEVGAPFNRSYFITDMKIDIGKKIIISCAVDVLQTYKDQIKPINANVIRSERTDMAEPYLPDSEFKIRAGFQNYTDVFSGAEASLYEQGEYVLNWIGGDYENSDRYIPLYDEPSDWNNNWGTYWILDSNEYAFRQLAGVYPSATTTPSFSVITATWGRVYYKLST